MASPAFTLAQAGKYLEGLSKASKKPAKKKLPDTGYSPEPIKLWPLILLAARKRRAGGAARLWILAKHLDTNGCGKISVAKLRSEAMRLGATDRSVRRWIAQARRLRLLIPITSKAGDVSLIIASYERGARFLRCEFAGSRYAHLPAKVLFKKHWLAHVWAAYLSTIRPTISRSRLTLLTGVPESTQKHWENLAGVERRPNYAVSNMGIDKLAGIREFQRPHAFAFREKRGAQEKVAWRLPDTRDVSDLAERGKRGRSRKINQALNGSSLWQSSVSNWRASSSVLKIFHATPKSTKATIRKIVRSDIPPWIVSEIYQERHRGRRATFYSVIVVHE